MIEVFVELVSRCAVAVAMTSYVPGCVGAENVVVIVPVAPDFSVPIDIREIREMVPPVESDIVTVTA